MLDLEKKYKIVTIGIDVMNKRFKISENIKI